MLEKKNRYLKSWKGSLWLMWLTRWGDKKKKIQERGRKKTGKKNRRPKVSSFTRGFTVLFHGYTVSAQPAPLHFENRNKSPDIDPRRLRWTRFISFALEQGRGRKQAMAADRGGGRARETVRESDQRESEERERERPLSLPILTDNCIYYFLFTIQ